MSKIPKTKHALRRICSAILSKPEEETTLDDIEIIKCIFQSHLDSGLSPRQIKEKYQIQYTDFGMFLKRCLGLIIKSHSEAAINFRIKDGSRITDEKELYRQKCQFRFNVKNFEFIPGLENISKLGIYHPTKNPNGLCRDHMVSVEYGWTHKIDPAIISHPANCQLISNSENISKNSNCHLTIDQLLARIDDITVPVDKIKVFVPKSEEHKKKISESIKRLYEQKNGARGEIRTLNPFGDGV